MPPKPVSRLVYQGYVEGKLDFFVRLVSSEEKDFFSAVTGRVVSSYNQ